MALHDYDHIKHHDRIARLYYEAIIDLVEHNEINKITVPMITEKTNTSRRTFYNYFPDKFSLMNYVYYYDVKDSYYQHLDAATFGPNSHSFFSDHLQKKLFYKKLFAYTGQNNFSEWFKNFWCEFYDEAGRAHFKNNYTVETALSIASFTLGLSETTKRWCLADCRTATPQQLAAVCEINQPPAFRELISSPTLYSFAQK